MFKPVDHCLWNYLPSLSQNPALQWAVPLTSAVEDFAQYGIKTIHVTGHLSIDNAFAPHALAASNTDAIKETLQVNKGFTFVSSSTQPVGTDVAFLRCFFEALTLHPETQVRLGLHPGIQDLDVYLHEILKVYGEYPQIHNQFKIILPKNLMDRIKTPELSIDDQRFQPAFLRVNVTGTEAAMAADKVAQVVPGALLNQAVLEGKPAYSHSGKSYLGFFATSLESFFKAMRHPLPNLEDLKLDTQKTGERYADCILANDLLSIC
jgi:hypothetical protein